MKIPYTILIISCFTLTFSKAQNLEKQFQHVLDSVYNQNDSAVGIMIHLEAPDQQISWTAAVGNSSKNTNEKLLKNQPALIASNTKTYVAATILKLIELNRITLEESIEGLIHKNTKELLKKDGYDLQNIQVKHLLSHTSGIADYVNDDYFEFINKHPKHKWKRSEQIQLAIEVGNPLDKPGKAYKYADINYLLLTEIIEQKMDIPFYLAINQLLNFKENGLNQTWFVNLEDTPDNSLSFVHQYWNKYNWDSYELDPSWDLYGGGGIASTVSDLSRFFSLLFNGKIIKDQSLIKSMHSFVLPEEESVYCLGLMHINFNGKEAYYHGGFWGTDVMYIPELNVSIAAFTLVKEMRSITNPSISKALIKIIKKK